jgi:hypothetical protein
MWGINKLMNDQRSSDVIFVPWCYIGYRLSFDPGRGRSN